MICSSRNFTILHLDVKVILQVTFATTIMGARRNLTKGAKKSRRVGAENETPQALSGVRNGEGLSSSRAN